MDTEFPVSTAPVADAWRTGAVSAPIPAEDISVESVKKFGIGSGPGGPGGHI